MRFKGIWALACPAIFVGMFLLQTADASAGSEGAKIVAGTLTCKGKGSIGLIIGSKETLTCTYMPAGNTPAQSYTATITTIGLDIGVKGASTMVWTVLSSTTDLPGEVLAGKYAGVSAEASIGVGGGANVLVGGSKDAVVLQPLSVQGQVGLNLAVGVSGLSLKHNK
ncbi:MAG: DUF992 domain-containing protein [Dongiaceae bacterium]